jgi:hypothetical protein
MVYRSNWLQLPMIAQQLAAPLMHAKCGSFVREVTRAAERKAVGLDA